MLYDEQNRLQRFKRGLSKNLINQRELRDSGSERIKKFCPQSLGVTLEFWYIERELFALPTIMILTYLHETGEKNYFDRYNKETKDFFNYRMFILSLEVVISN